MIPLAFPATLHGSLTVAIHLLAALALGSMIGFERSYHGRAAGLRTYALVCSASALLTALCGQTGVWFGGPGGAIDVGAVSRVIQGLLTGIGFLGAGVIMREGFTIRGLSTAASIWMTAAIGVTTGLGLLPAALFATLLVVVVMANFRQIEDRLPHQRIAHLTLVYARRQPLPTGYLEQRLAPLGFSVSGLSCRLDGERNRFEYRLILVGGNTADFPALAEIFAKEEEIVEFQLAASHD